MTESDNLPALLARIETGDEAALMDLLQRYEPRLRTAARVLLGPLLRPHLDTIDLVQSVHRVLVPGLRAGDYHFADPDQVVALALTVLRRKVAANWRKVKSEQPGDVPELASPGASDPALTAQLRDGLEQVLSHLTEAERQLVELRLDGLAPADMAAHLGCDAHVLRSRLSKLRQKLYDAGAPEWF
ncbi:MAG: sigma-70 family RNA polymerase sigma factor [Gemmataceae bacterium]|nr:sigma-70 family RNA polymerase sigma factor [Gemmataceae bacterium]